MRFGSALAKVTWYGSFSPSPSYCSPFLTHCCIFAFLSFLSSTPPLLLSNLLLFLTVFFIGIHDLYGPELRYSTERTKERVPASLNYISNFLNSFFLNIIFYSHLLPFLFYFILFSFLHTFDVYLQRKVTQPHFKIIFKILLCGNPRVIVLPHGLVCNILLLF